MPKPKGTPLTPQQKEKMHAGLAAYHEAKKAGTWVPKKGKKPKAGPTEPETLEPESDYAEVADLLDTLPEGQLADLHVLALQVIKDALTGLKVLVNVTDGKTPQLLKGTAALWQVDTPEGARFVYQYRPDIKLAQFVAQHAEGKPGTRELQAKATTVIFRSSLPGKDAEINAYLKSLDPEVLKKFAFDQPTLEAIHADGSEGGCPSPTPPPGSAPPG